MLEFQTPGMNGYAVKYSPFFDNRIAIAASANFGLVGNGRLYICGLGADGVFAEKWFDTQDALYDVAWSEIHENQLVVGSGDGSVKLYDISLNDFPVQSWQEHRREVYSVSWNLVAKDTLASSSWDGTIKIWNPQRASSILTLPTHSCTYSVAFSPHSPSVLSSVTSDSHLRVFDLRTPASASNHLVHLVPLHGGPPQPGRASTYATAPSECLTHDWNKYRTDTLATAGVDTIIRTWDLRNPQGGPLALLTGHDYAVRKVAWSPHLPDVLLSASYDMTCRVWSDGFTSQTPGHPGISQGRELGRMSRHTEFCTGIDWCLFGAEGWCASVSWDKRLLIWDVRAVMS
ncbi:putative peroxisome biosynthesis protein (Peroxine-7) [Bisporella sp. PMI_857]|nr:putative peroxisome biosynthesis protein (Peroxine-7) [Bisporella sp. PMI_857]